MGTNSNTPRRTYTGEPTTLSPTSGALSYTTAAAFRTALKARFTAIAKQDPRYSVNELQRQFAYDRILSRCFSTEDAQRWVLKGAGALLARLPDARHSKDIDLYYAELTAVPDEATAALVATVNRDIGDHFRFEVTKTTPPAGGSEGSPNPLVGLPRRTVRDLPRRRRGRHVDERSTRSRAAADSAAH